LAQRWFRRCVETHVRCNLVDKKMTGWYPTRLIDLGSFDSEPRLIITKYTNMEGPYQGIPSSSIPRTFLDAMEIARRLEVRYIWIDSLCIIQDSRADWLKEASLMHQVYSGSLCNISATSGRDSSLGLFTKRDPSLLFPCRIKMSWNDRPESFYQIDYTSFWTSQVLDAPLNQRAWVVQERLLSPRVLHFGHQQILWECRELDAAERYPEKLPLALASGQGFYKALDPLTDDPHQQNEDNRGQKLKIFQGWYRILGTYSDSLLSNPEDKLIAISGIARKMQAIMPDNRYGAGLWLGYLPKTPYRAPSFSWASLDGSITPGWFTDASDTSQKIVADVVEVFVEPEAGDMIGPVKAGFVRIRGQL
ncbi:HET-domain-containing protein, partial [Glonium stellatum]